MAEYFFYCSFENRPEVLSCTGRMVKAAKISLLLSEDVLKPYHFQVFMLHVRQEFHISCLVNIEVLKLWWCVFE